MRELSDDFKLSVRSLAETFAAINTLDTEYSRTRRVQFRGKRLTREAIVNAAVVYLHSLPDEERERALTAGAAMLELALADSTEEANAAQARLNAALAGADRPAVGEVVRDGPVARPIRKRKA